MKFLSTSAYFFLLIGGSLFAQSVLLSPQQKAEEGPMPTDRVGVFRPSTNTFYLDVNGDNSIDAADDRIAVMGEPGDQPFPGQWNSQNPENLGLHRKMPFAEFFLDVDGNNRINTPADRVFFYFLQPTVLPVKGDWNGSGQDKVGVLRTDVNQFRLDVNDDEFFGTGDLKFQMGAPGDLPISGDWNGDGIDTIGLFRPSTNTFYLDTDGNGQITGSDTVRAMGAAGDLPIVGDWNADRTDHLGLFRPSTNVFYLDLNNNGRIEAGDIIFGMGAPGDIPLVGKW